MSDISKIKLPSGDIYNIKDIEARATVGNLSEVAYSGSYDDLEDKPTIPTVPTNVSAFTNDSGYITNSALSGYATETYVTDAIGDLVGVKFGGPYNSVSALPATGSGDTIYLVSNSGSGQNTYDEYLWITNKYEKIGTTEIDLTNYALKSELPTKVSDLTNDSGFISGITSSDVTTALGYTPYNSTNPNGYITSSDLPTKTSDLTNDSGFITSSDLPGLADANNNGLMSSTQYSRVVQLTDTYINNLIDAKIDAAIAGGY